MIREATHFIRRVGDIDDRDAQMRAQAFEVGQDVELAVDVEARQRLIHQQQFGVCQQGARHGHALLLPARQGGWFAFQ
jgi:hypothetical protein